MEKITLKELDYGELGFLYEKIKKEMEAYGVSFPSPIVSNYVVKATLVVLSNLTIEEREKVLKEWSSSILKEKQGIINEMTVLNDRKINLSDTVHNLSQEAVSKRMEIKDLNKEYKEKQMSKEKELESLLKEKQDAITLESERLHQVRSELAKARRERNDYIKESERIVGKAKLEAKNLMQQTLKDAEERAITKTIQIEENAKKRLEWVNKMIKAASDYRKALLEVEEANAKYIAIGSLMISVFGEKVKDVADSICNTVGSSRVRVTIPSETSLAFWKACQETNFKEDS